MRTKNHQRKATTTRGRHYLGRKALVVVIGGAFALSIGVGVAAAQNGSARTVALSRARAVSAGWPSAKAKLYQQGVARAFPVTPKAKPDLAKPGPQAAPGVPTIVVPDARQHGISNLRQAPFGTADFAVRNSYSALVKGRWYVAYAGTIGGDVATSGEGGIRVLSADATQNNGITDLGTFAAAGTRSLEVTAYSGDTITLVANTGATFIFNLDTLTYQ
jgi:hypothetical protein